MIINESKKLDESLNDTQRALEQAGVNFHHGDVMDWSSNGSVSTFEFSCEIPERKINDIKKKVESKHSDWDVTITKYREYSMDCFTMKIDERPSRSSSNPSGWYIKAYNGNNSKNAKIVKCSSKFDAASKRSTLLKQYDNADVFDGEDFIDPSEL